MTKHHADTVATANDKEFTQKNEEAIALAIREPASFASEKAVFFQNPPLEGTILRVVAGQNAAAATTTLSNEDLPEEVRKNILGFDQMILQERIASILSEGNTMSVDKIVLSLWRNYNFTIDRMKIIACLRKMVKERLVEKDLAARSLYRISTQAAAQPEKK